MSRIGNKEIGLPEKVNVSVDDASVVTVEGPKGKLQWELPKGISVSQEETGVKVARSSEERRVRALHGTARSLIANMVTGVSEGYTKDLRVEGTGYRANQEGANLSLAVGLSHGVTFEPPEGVTFEVPKGNKQILIHGIDKESVGQIAAEIRAVRPPEPYKGKGIRYADEQIRRKAGKAGKAKK